MVLSCLRRGLQQLVQCVLVPRTHPRPTFWVRIPRSRTRPLPRRARSPLSPVPRHLFAVRHAAARSAESPSVRDYRCGHVSQRAARHPLPAPTAVPAVHGAAAAAAAAVLACRPTADVTSAAYLPPPTPAIATAVDSTTRGQLQLWGWGRGGAAADESTARGQLQLRGWGRGGAADESIALDAAVVAKPAAAVAADAAAAASASSSLRLALAASIAKPTVPAAPFAGLPPAGRPRPVVQRAQHAHQPRVAPDLRVVL